MLQCGKGAHLGTLFKCRQVLPSERVTGGCYKLLAVRVLVVVYRRYKRGQKVERKSIVSVVKTSLPCENVLTIGIHIRIETNKIINLQELALKNVI